MRFIPAITRRIHSAATTLHIRGLRAAVNASASAVARATRRTDDASVAAITAKWAHEAARKDEGRIRNAHRATWSAAQAEARSLRRDASL